MSNRFNQTGRVIIKPGEQAFVQMHGPAGQDELSCTEVILDGPAPVNSMGPHRDQAEKPPGSHSHSDLCGGEPSSIWRDPSQDDCRMPISDMPCTRAVVAVVDDDPGTRTSLRRLLQPEEFGVTTFESGQIFLHSLANGNRAPDCLIVDFQMPGLSGIDVLAALERMGKRIPAIVITGSSEDKISERVFKAGAVAFFEKPFEGAPLVAAIRRCIDAQERRASDT